MSFASTNAAEAAFYAAFRELDLAAMAGVWLDSPSCSCIHPGGVLIQGIAAVLDSWRDIFRDSATPRIEYRLIQASADARLAVHTVEEHISVGSHDREARVLATNVYSHTDDGWRLVAHHASLPLVEKSAKEPRRQPPLH